MAITSLDDCLTFLDIDKGYFTITKSNNTLNFTSSSGGPVNIDLTDGTYDGTTLASHIQTQMNANTTLTGTGAITFAVSYSSTTRLFTINAGTGKTIAYTHTSSDAGLTVGFDSNKSAAQTITSDIPAGDPTEIVDIIREDVEKLISDYCRRIFEETSYRLERYDGSGGSIINLDNYPITAVDRISISTLGVIRVRNTNAYSTATVSVTTTGLRLVLDGTADTTVTFASYATIADIVGAISALGDGWEAETTSSTYSSFKSNELIPVYGLNAINNNWVDLYKTDDPEDDFYVDLNKGQIRKYGGWPSGFRNIYVDYSAGYTSDNMPRDLKLAVKILVKYFLNRRNEDSFGLTQYRVGNNSVLSVFESGNLPKEATQIIERYKRRRC